MNVLPVPTACPKCGGKLFDNRNSPKRTNPKAPTHKCANYKNCDGCIWPLRAGQIYADEVSGAPKTAAQQDEDYGFPIPGEFTLPGKDAPNAPAPTVRLPKVDKGVASLDALFDLHGACWSYAERVSKEDSVRASIAATLLIAATKAGI